MYTHTHACRKQKIEEEEEEERKRLLVAEKCLMWVLVTRFRERLLLALTAPLHDDRNTLQHIATHCNTLQHTATHHNTAPLHDAQCRNAMGGAGAQGGGGNEGGGGGGRGGAWVGGG